MKKLIIGSAILLCIVSSSCKKDASSNTNCDKNVASIAGTYSFVKYEAGMSGVFQDVTHDFLEPCELDDKLTLNTNGTTLYKDLGTACDPSGDETGTWAISSDGKMTINDGTVDVSVADITSFDCSTLVLTGTETGGSGIQFRVTMKK